MPVCASHEPIATSRSLLLLLRAPGKLQRQAGLAETGFSRDEADPPATLQSIRQESAQLGEFLVPRDEDRFQTTLSWTREGTRE